MKRHSILVFVVLAALSSLSLAQPRRPMSPADILRVAAISDAQISPDGRWVVYSVSTVDGDKNQTTLWLARVTEQFSSQLATPAISNTDWPSVRSSPTPLLPAGWSASNPRWSPDGATIAFLAERDNISGIWTVALSRHEPRFLASVQQTNFFITYAGEPFSWSPDSKRIAYISAVEDSEERLSLARRSDDPRVIDRIQYKSRTALSDRLRTHIFVTDIERPEPRQLTSGSAYDHALSFSPRGDEIAFLSNHDEDPDANNNSDIFTVNLGGQMRQLTNTKGCEYEPAWSPDGRWLAYTASKRDVTTIDSVAEDAHVWIIAAAGGSGRELSEEQDRRARDPQWSPDSRSVLYVAGDRGVTSIFRVSVNGGKIDRFVAAYVDGLPIGSFDSERPGFRSTAPRSLRAFVVGSFSVAQRTTSVVDRGSVRTVSALALTLSDALHPAELWFGWDAMSPLQRLSAHNDSVVAGSRLSEPEELSFKSFDGTPIQAWIIKPTGFREDQRYPMILSVHGGPHGMFGWGFNQAFQVYAARGYAVLYINPRGSSGYGQKFSDGTLNEWGGGDYRDLMRGVDEALRKYSWIDSGRLGVTGGSYGGFMTNWIITQTPRFKAAVAVASVSNLISFYSTSLYQDLVHAEFGGFPWDNYDLLWQWSPLRYIKQAETPTLFIHGEQDNDVHITQAEEMYMGLRRRGVETVLVRYPREGHGLREPRHRVDALERTIAWFDRFLK
ncbi:MAG TPA: S9 family peptidase [Pyrinomonadaceae bacterium]|nr:S9 family peptidase [Pyrinomonadaceae bacterium]